MRQYLFSTLGLGLSMLALAGCGTSGHLSFPTHHTYRRTSSSSLHSASAQHLTRYAALIHRIGPILSQRSMVPVYLPTYLGMGSGNDLNVLYQTQNGYRVTFGGGPPLPPNSSRNPGFGNAELLGTIWGLPASSSIQCLFHRYIPPDLPGPSLRVKTLTLTPTITGTLYQHAPSGRYQILWHQGEWLLEDNSNVGLGFSGFLRSAQQIAHSLGSIPLPGHDGMAIFAYGAPDAPSEATYRLGRGRYFVYANGFRSVTWSRRMHRLTTANANLSNNPH